MIFKILHTRSNVHLMSKVQNRGTDFQTGNISGMAGDAECYDEANDFIREAIAGMADDAEYKRLST